MIKRFRPSITSHQHYLPTLVVEDQKSPHRSYSNENIEYGFEIVAVHVY